MVVSISLRGESRGDGLPPVVSGELPPRRAPPRARAGGVAPRGPGSDVSTTQMVSLAGSAQQSVPVEPVWPKVCSEHPGLPDSLPTPNPNPRGVNPAGLWFLIISRAVSGLTTLPRAPMNSPRNLATIRRGSVRSSPGSAQLPPVGTVPIPLLGLRIAAPRFGRGTFHLARDHLFQLEPSESLSRVLHAQGLKDMCGRRA